MTRDGLLLRMSEEDWDTVLDTNLKGAFLFTKGFTRALIKQRTGRIINVASVIGLIGNAGQTNYAASKAALIGFTKSRARELATRGITVNAIAPALVTTEMVTSNPNARADRIPLGRYGVPEEVAQVAVMLAGNGYVTGQTVNVNGGWFMS
jgi:3-oxoacyl-[acyl-carrier protein] reductase